MAPTDRPHEADPEELADSQRIAMATLAGLPYERKAAGLVPDRPLVAAVGNAERRRAVRYGRRTIDESRLTCAEVVAPMRPAWWPNAVKGCAP